MTDAISFIGWPPQRPQKGTSKGKPYARSHAPLCIALKSECEEERDSEREGGREKLEKERSERKRKEREER